MQLNSYASGCDQPRPLQFFSLQAATVDFPRRVETFRSPEFIDFVPKWLFRWCRLALAPPSLPAAANSATLDRPVARLALFHLHLGKLSPLDLLEDIARMTLRWAHGARESSLKTCTSKVPPW